ncbi:hypothetical protein QWJ38_17095 [Pelomonas sp. PFR6]|uniref:Lipoprotein n=2 Tax=Roseateles violae TaxID=3058042 RepID=A0ABT8DUM4_9BURK|nr:hypothetical protein [Pelomonas sp. PFR6]MDN3922010.1 hypothetical protein [Pelomonas sp. PFR6]
MKTKLGLACATSLMMALGAAPARAADVGVSISVGQPGFYGQIDIGTMRPQLIYTEPVVIHRTQVVGAPMYLRVPPGHEKHWDKHCKKYNACGRPVYFVKDDWYERDYVPYYQEQHGKGKGHDKGEKGGKGKGHGKGHD